MSAAGPSINFRDRFLKLFGYTVIAVTMGAVIWGILRLGGELFSQAKHLRCQDNLKVILAGLSLYRQTYDNQLPPYLSALLPMIDNRLVKLQCPADPDEGRKGCRPAWMRELDPEGAFDNADLDGPALDPELATNRFPCSYLYAANVYPCALAEPGRTWRHEYKDLVRKFGNTVPMVRCYYHLRPSYKLDPADPTIKDFDPAATPTYNITADLTLRECKLDWQSDQAAATPNSAPSPQHPVPFPEAG